MSTASLIPMLDPDGNPGLVPRENAAAAVRAGGRIGVVVISPEGERGIIPQERYADALRAGARPAPPHTIQGDVVPQPRMIDQGGPAAGKLSGLPGVNPHSPTTGEMVGDVALAASPMLSIGGPAAGTAARTAAVNAVRALPTLAAMEGINYARRNLPWGKYIPAGAELVPLLMSGGGKSKVSPAAETAETEEAAVASRPAVAAPSVTPTRTAQIEHGLSEALGARPLKPGVPMRMQQVGEAVAADVPKDFTPVSSTAIRGYKYNPAAQEIETVSASGQRYVHGDVSPDQFAEFESATSKGQAWNALKQNSVLVAKYVGGKRVPVKPSIGLSKILGVE